MSFYYHFITSSKSSSSKATVDKRHLLSNWFYSQNGAQRCLQRNKPIFFHFNSLTTSVYRWMGGITVFLETHLSWFPRVGTEQHWESLLSGLEWAAVISPPLHQMRWEKVVLFVPSCFNMQFWKVISFPSKALFSIGFLSK